MVLSLLLPFPLPNLLPSAKRNSKRTRESPLNLSTSPLMTKIPALIKPYPKESSVLSNNKRKPLKKYSLLSILSSSILLGR